MRYRELQQTLLHTQAKLQEIVQEMPEIKEKRRQLDVEETKIRELSKKVAEKTGEAQ
jgi:regulator of replication initiation timing